MNLLESLKTSAYKVVVLEVVDLALSRYVASTGKPMIVSTGIASEDETDEAVTTAREAGCNDLMLLHRISSYPAPMDQANLRQMSDRAKRFDVSAGLYFVKDLPAGHVIEPGDIRRIRPGLGLAREYYNEVVGKRLVCDVVKGTLVTRNTLRLRFRLKER